MFPPVSVNLHRWFDVTKNKKPTGWFWIPTDDALAIFHNMHFVYVGKEFSSEKTGETANERLDPETVCPFPVVLEGC